MGGRGTRGVRAAGGEAQTIEPLTVAAWEKWLRAGHATQNGVWLRLHRKSAGTSQLTVVDALERYRREETRLRGWK